MNFELWGPLVNHFSILEIACRGLDLFLIPSMTKGNPDLTIMFHLCPLGCPSSPPPHPPSPPQSHGQGVRLRLEGIRGDGVQVIFRLPGECFFGAPVSTGGLWWGWIRSGGGCRHAQGLRVLKRCDLICYSASDLTHTHTHNPHTDKQSHPTDRKSVV